LFEKSWKHLSDDRYGTDGQGLSPLLTIENTRVGPLVPTVTLPKFAVDGKIVAAGPLRA